MARRPVVSLDEHNRRSVKLANGILLGGLRRARAAGVACQSDYAQSDHPYQAIIQAAERLGCDAIFMASHGRKGLGALWHGSQTMDVLTHSKIPTLVYR